MTNSLIRVPVAVSPQPYTVSIGAGVLNKITDHLPAGKKIAVISDETVFTNYGESLCAKLNTSDYPTTPIIISAGEQYKNMTTLNTVLTQMVEANIGRDGWVIGLGGGVITDIAGFAAAIYLRGIAILHIPTTLLGQVDAAIGGKTGVNHRLGKNLLGAFHQPAAVLCDTDVLATLPPREYNAGLAEVLKCGLFGNKDFFAWLEENAKAIMARDNDALIHALSESVKMKAAVVAADEKEKGRRALLNLGHTFAHAIEASAGYGDWLHGEAVAVGLIAAARLSEKINAFPAADTARIVAVLKLFSLPTTFPDIATDTLLAAMTLDKKNTATQVRFTLLKAIGNAELTTLKDNTPLIKTIEEMR